MSEEITCSECGITFGVPDAWIRDKRENGNAFYCPNGHEQYFLGKSAEEKLKEELERTKASHQAEINRVVKEKEWAKQEAKLAKYDAKIQRSHAKAAVTISRKLRQRLKTGLCPCCEVKFDNLEDHMKKEHPRYR